MDRENFKELLKIAKITKKEFANIANVPYGTVNNWGLLRDGKTLPVPGWVEPFMQYYLQAKKLEYIEREICLKMRDNNI